jgi:hypothetical protein
MAKLIWRFGSGLSESLFPVNQSLGDWVEYAQLFVQSTPPNAGRYVASVDESISELWALFTGTSQPANWNSAILIDLSAQVASEQAAAGSWGRSIAGPFALGSFGALVVDIYNTGETGAGDAATAKAQTTAAAIKAAARTALNGLWRDEFGNGFTNNVTDP